MMENNSFEAQKEKSNKTLPICISLIVVVCLCLGGFYFYSSSPKQILSSVLNKAYAKYDEVVNQDLTFDLAQDSVKFEGDLNLDTNIEGLEQLKEDVIAISGGIDYKNKKAEGSISLKESNKTIVNIIAYIIENRLYMTLGDDYKGLIDAREIDSSELFKLDQDEKTNFNKKDINYIVKAYKDIIVNSIDDKALVKGETTITLDGKETKVNKLTYELSDENLSNFYKKVIEKTLEDKELVKTLAKITEAKENDLIDALKEAKDEKLPSVSEKMSIEIYTNGLMSNNFVGFSVKVGKDVAFDYIENKDNSIISLTAGDILKATITIKENTDTKFNADYEIKYGETNISGNLTAATTKINKNRYNGSINFTIKYNEYKASIKTNYSLEVGAKIADIDTTKAIDAEKASNDLYNAINNITNRFATSNIGSIINGLSNSYAE